MIKYFTLAVLTLFAVPASAAAPIEKEMVDTMMTYCVSSVSTKGDTAKMAEANNLPEFPQEQAKTFLNGAGRVFTLPGYIGKVLLIVRDNGMCSVAASAFNAAALWQEIDAQFGANTAFKKMSDKTQRGNHRRHYVADFDGNTSLFINARNTPVKGQLQGLMSFSRTK